jgi:hypothetical protein
LSARASSPNRSHDYGSRAISSAPANPKAPELYRKKVAKLQHALQQEATRSQIVETIRSLIDRIEVLPDQQRGLKPPTVSNLHRAVSRTGGCCLPRPAARLPG